MIRKNSLEWKLMLSLLKKSSTKSNRDYLCIKCWEILTYERMRVHKDEKEDHISSILSSKYFTTEDKLVSIAKDCDKWREFDGIFYIESPYRQSFGRTKGNRVSFQNNVSLPIEAQI